ncbi:MAG: protein kinase, partial [Gemmataceae bacterium]|nr:protein kinase [Gemmataceae bacterium]
TELGACEWFVWDLRRSNLLDRGRLDQIVSEFLAKNPRAEPPALAEYLVSKNILTQFQAERLLQGKTQGFVLGPYTLMDALGAGSMGTVYKAQSKTDNNWYAVKVLPRRSMWNVRIARRKVRSFEQARHPTVVPFVDVGTAGGMHYLAWPLVEGETLDKIVERDGKLAPHLAAYIGMKVAEGLDVCHQQGLIHGLLKPSNIMLGPDNQVFILDFGIGCLLAEAEGESLVDTMSTANSVTSGLDCASPESIMDPTNLTPAGDQYSLGCTLYYLLAGRYPFPDGNAAEKMMAHQFQTPTPLAELNPEVPPGLVQVVEKLMQKAPDARYESAAEAVEALRPWGNSSSGAVARPAARKSSGLLPRPKPTPARTAAAAKPTEAPAKLAAPSTPTPKPQAIGSLPNRDALRASKAAAPALPQQPPTSTTTAAPPAEATDRPAAVASVEAAEQQRTWEDQLGPLGIAMSAGLACALVYLAAVCFKLF